MKLPKHEQQQKSIFHEMQKQLRKHFSKQLCMVPPEMKSQCSSKKPKCHTISKSASLKKISVENHVYIISPGNDDFYQKIGINQATVFYGFCTRHDTEIFLPIENEKSSIHTPKQLFLLAYRALCLRLYNKRASKEFLGSDIISPRINYNDEISCGVDAAIKDLEFYKKIYDSILIDRDYTKITTLLITFDIIPLVMGTGFIFPEIDLNQNIVNDLRDPLIRLIRPMGFSISCISFPSNNEGIIALSVTNESRNLLESYYEKLKTKDANEILEIIIKLLFLYEENIVFNIHWWDSLSEELKSVIRNMYHVHIRPMFDDEFYDEDLSKVNEFMNTYYGLFPNTMSCSLKIIGDTSPSRSDMTVTKGN